MVALVQQSGMKCKTCDHTIPIASSISHAAECNKTNTDSVLQKGWSAFYDLPSEALNWRVR
jgi:hypothetical protein